MKRIFGILLLSAVLIPGFAFAEAPAAHEAAPGAHGEAAAGGHEAAAHEESASAFILHHVSDDESWTLEIPVPPYHAFTLNISSWFAPLKIERVAGACSHEDPAWAAFPSLGKFIGGCWDLRPTKAIFMMWVATALLFLFLALGRKRDANGVPQGLVAHLVEVLALFVRDEICVPNIGKAEAPRYTPYLTSLFFFVLFVNWLGLIPGMFTGTGVIAVTAALALITFVVVQIAGIRAAGLGGYLKHLTGGVAPMLWVVMIPVEVLGLFTKPFALLVRLFANMLGGHMVIFFLLSLIFLWPGWAVVSVPLAIAIYVLEMFVGILQAYLFTLLTTLFIGQGIAMGHHAHHDEPHGEPAHGEAH
jgi:F-type H+-transporting ATPase subunit a